MPKPIYKGQSAGSGGPASSAQADIAPAEVASVYGLGGQFRLLSLPDVEYTAWKIRSAFIFMVYSLLPLFAEGTTVEASTTLPEDRVPDLEYDIYDFTKEIFLPIVIGIMTVVGVMTSFRAMARMVRSFTCLKKHCSDKAVQTSDPVTEIIYPDHLWVTKAGERYHSDHHCSGFRLHKVTPCSFCVPRKLSSSQE